MIKTQIGPTGRILLTTKLHRMTGSSGFGAALRRTRAGILLGLSIGSVVAATVGTAGAQVRQLNPQNALDRNPMVGSGGSNTPVPGYVPINGNDVITGNVAGLKYFHGRVGTSNPYEFQGTLGTSTLGNFARQSAPTPYNSNGAASTYYLPSQTVSSAQGTIAPSPYGGGFDQRVIPQTSVNAAAARGVVTNGYTIPVRAFDRSVIATTPALSQQEAASPLFGFRQRMSPGYNVAPGADVANGGVENRTGNTTGGNDNTNNTNGENGKNNATPEDHANPNNQSSNWNSGLSKTWSVNASAGGPVEQVKPGADGKGVPANAGASLAVSRTYEDLLRSLQRSREPGEATPGGTTNNGAPNTGVASNNPGNTGNTGNLGTPRATGDTGTPIANGKGTGTGLLPNAGGGQSVDPTKPDYRPRLGVPRAERLTDTPVSVLRSAKDIKPLKTLADVPAGVMPTSFEALMKQAEGLLKEGKYMEAADRYQSALIGQPNDALAMVGRAHAELGAGMYESAAWDLKFVYTNHPELVGVRYEVKEFLPEKRLDYLIKDLEGMTTRPATGATASFLVSYLYYQTGREADLQAELGRWEHREWKDSWTTVLTKAWSTEK